MPCELVCQLTVLVKDECTKYKCLCLKLQKIENIHAVKAKCVVFDGLARLKRIYTYFTVVIMNDEILLLLPLR